MMKAENRHIWAAAFAVEMAVLVDKTQRVEPLPPNQQFCEAPSQPRRQTSTFCVTTGQTLRAQLGLRRRESKTA